MHSVLFKEEAINCEEHIHCNYIKGASIILFREKLPHSEYVSINIFILYNPNFKRFPLWLVR